MPEDQERRYHGTRVTHHTLYAKLGLPVIVPHDEGCTVSVVSAEYVGGGAEKQYQLDVLIIGPASEEEARDAHSREPFADASVRP